MPLTIGNESLKTVKQTDHLFHMPADASTHDHSIDNLSRALAGLVHDGTPAISAFAAWALEHPQEMAFHSVRGLAKLAETNVNTVYRLAIALGFSGFDECRAAFQSAMRNHGGLYGQRAAKLNSDRDSDLFGQLRKASRDNLDAIFDQDFVTRIKDACALLTSARRVFCVGVRSGYSLAHYFAYSGRMAFENFALPLSGPGGIADAISEAGPEDVVVVMTFSLYSAEVVRAHAAALDRGARIIAMTDTYASPIARHADIVFCLPMSGPQTLPSQAAGFTLIETIIAHMIAGSGTAPDRIAEFERRMLEIGGYLSAGPDTD